MIGLTVGNYRLVELVGEGGMGSVYRATDVMLERDVAIKILRSEYSRQPELLERFRSEAITQSRLHHPNVATLYSFERQGDHYFMVMEFVHGTTLSALVAQGAMVCDYAQRLFVQVLDGIEHAHQLGIIHRDIKPSNIMVTRTGLVKVMDFGIARALGQARQTRVGHVIGTFEYMSPERVLGQDKDVDIPSDIYSLGVLLYEMLTGTLPFGGENEFAIMKAHVNDPPVPPRTFAPHITPQLEAAILKAMAKQPQERFPSTREFRAAVLGIDTRRGDAEASGPKPTRLWIREDLVAPAPQAIPAPIVRRAIAGKAAATRDGVKLAWSRLLVLWKRLVSRYGQRRVLALAAAGFLLIAALLIRTFSGSASGREHEAPIQYSPQPPQLQPVVIPSTDVRSLGDESPTPPPPPEQPTPPRKSPTMTEDQANELLEREH